MSSSQWAEHQLENTDNTLIFTYIYQCSCCIMTRAETEIITNIKSCLNRRKTRNFSFFHRKKSSRKILNNKSLIQLGSESNYWFIGLSSDNSQDIFSYNLHQNRQFLCMMQPVLKGTWVVFS